jgi:hypothetical protein
MNKILLILLIFASLLILAGYKLLLSYVSAQVTGGLSTNSVNKSNVTSHVIGEKSNITSGGLSTNSVNKSNVTSHVIGEKSNITSGGLSTNSVNKSNVTSHK